MLISRAGCKSRKSIIRFKMLECEIQQKVPDIAGDSCIYVLKKEEVYRNLPKQDCFLSKLTEP